ncbi:hypothetical protein [Actinokineospora sp. UTMC 2448]|uniref:hypothetical protein n=1 Tax=Actinokineospora sp. UTMC 2448 TaxID=2268449 RepID=UPI0021647BED|nr:hypothetical protein [Actinokineospora sp. UTMC 2448]
MAALVAELNLLCVAGGFSRQEVAARMAADSPPGQRPPYHVPDGQGGWRPNLQRISDQLSPRDKCSPPDPDLVERIIVLHAEATGADPAQTRRRVNTLYRPAAAAAEKIKDKRVVGKDGRPEGPVERLRDRVTEFRAALHREQARSRRLATDLHAAVRSSQAELSAREQEVSAQRHRAQQAERILRARDEHHREELAAAYEQIAALQATVERQQLELIARDIELERLQTQVDQQRIELERLESRLAAVRAENTRLNAEILTGDLDTEFDTALQALLAQAAALEPVLAGARSRIRASARENGLDLRGPSFSDHRPGPDHLLSDTPPTHYRPRPTPQRESPLPTVLVLGLLLTACITLLILIT